MKNFKSIALILFFILSSTLILQAQAPTNPTDISPLLIGEELPDVNLIDTSGESVSLNKQIKKANTVLVFYRGGWCPYCNRQLSALALAEKEIIKLGYQIIAISPDDYKNLEPTMEKGDFKYKLYSDAHGDFIKQLGIAFYASTRTKKYISNKTIGKTTELLPVPTVLVVNKKGKILFEYISPNYRKRITPALLLAVLKNLE